MSVPVTDPDTTSRNLPPRVNNFSSECHPIIHEKDNVGKRQKQTFVVIDRIQNNVYQNISPFTKEKSKSKKKQYRHME